MLHIFSHVGSACCLHVVFRLLLHLACILLRWTLGLRYLRKLDLGREKCKTYARHMQNTLCFAYFRCCPGPCRLGPGTPKICKTQCVLHMSCICFAFFLPRSGFRKYRSPRVQRNKNANKGKNHAKTTQTKNQHAKTNMNIMCKNILILVTLACGPNNLINIHIHTLSMLSFVAHTKHIHSYMNTVRHAHACMYGWVDGWMDGHGCVCVCV